MTPLERNALSSLTLTAEEVAGIYAIYPPPLADTSRLVSVIRRLCESHERLRAELQGATILLDEDAREREKTTQETRP